MFADDFSQDWPSFKAWLQENEMLILEPTNPYEVARFTTPSETLHHP